MYEYCWRKNFGQNYNCYVWIKDKFEYNVSVCAKIYVQIRVVVQVFDHVASVQYHIVLLDMWTIVSHATKIIYKIALTINKS